MNPKRTIRAITLDLDDTLWPCEPVMLKAEAALEDWLNEQCPEIAAMYPRETMRALRSRVFEEHPHLAHDFMATRKMSLAKVFEPYFDRSASEGQQWVERAFEVFHSARHEVELYPDALAALESLAAKYPLATLSNGTADVHRIGLAHHFVAQVSARVVGHAKPHPLIFHRAAKHLEVLPEQVAHVGDDAALDVVGAKAAGMLAVWLNRDGRPWPLDEVTPDLEIATLAELEPALSRLG